MCTEKLAKSLCTFRFSWCYHISEIYVSALNILILFSFFKSLKGKYKSWLNDKKLNVLAEFWRFVFICICFYLTMLLLICISTFLILFVMFTNSLLVKKDKKIIEDNGILSFYLKKIFKKSCYKIQFIKYLIKFAVENIYF